MKKKAAMQRVLDRTMADLAKAEAEIERLTAALRPFADRQAARDVDERVMHEDAKPNALVWVRVSWDQILEARAALEHKP